ncbi:toll/interleukin-1 receptor domain-containing protein [Paenibacillus sp. IHB B 3415]|uniref:toll/interleukin-1 receptor domain-containing protein n=1 Tax=Paenibacillus sp. IHB B 3415 TaxID=867080 RepID=UPI00069A086D|nr:TIR domain-containing protein [Paenibacillus sp. IHB B 3415]
MKSKEVIHNLLMILKGNNIRITKQCLRVFQQAEEMCEKYDVSIFHKDLFAFLLIESEKIRNIIDKYGGNSFESIEFLMGNLNIKARKEGGFRYFYGDDGYSLDENNNDERSYLLIECFRVMQDRKSVLLDDEVLLTALINCHDKESPPFDNASWNDQRFHFGYNTLSHLIGTYFEGLWVKHDLIKWEFVHGNLKKYHLVISFAGEDRRIAKEIATRVTQAGYTVFYDEFEKDKLWGKDLYSYLSELYKDKGEYCLMIISEHYSRKFWTKHERLAAQARAFKENREYILPLILDDTEIPGILPTVGYLDLRENCIEEIIDILIKKLRGINEELI